MKVKDYDLTEAYETAFMLRKHDLSWAEIKLYIKVYFGYEVTEKTVKNWVEKILTKEEYGRG